ncbi:MAG: response regulator transcription factor [Anaerolineales bacterium]|nr:response regulator transcription factor [Chloroflexota bacterium]MBL6979582.1 response regulator transcription factor [Anaerolineales bacterium]
MGKIRVLIADDHPVYRFGLRSLLTSLPDMEVVGEAETGQDAVQQAAQLCPDIILMDINMPGINGIEATRIILENRPETAILIITMFDDETIFHAMQAGALGYILKGADPEETERAIRAVASGEAIFSPQVAERLINYFRQHKPNSKPNYFPELTERELEILDLVVHGLTNSAIAERLVLSPKTVRNHVSKIFGKLQVSNRTQAILRARDAGIGK